MHDMKITALPPKDNKPHAFAEIREWMDKGIAELRDTKTEKADWFAMEAYRRQALLLLDLFREGVEEHGLEKNIIGQVCLPMGNAYAIFSAISSNASPGAIPLAVDAYMGVLNGMMAQSLHASIDARLRDGKPQGMGH